MATLGPFYLDELESDLAAKVGRFNVAACEGDLNCMISTQLITLVKVWELVVYIKRSIRSAKP